MKPHKHAELIKAWADGAEIQRKHIICGQNINEPILNEAWVLERAPDWSCHSEYRIKPEPKPDVVLYSIVGKVVDFQPCSPYVCLTNAYSRLPNDIDGNLKLTFDGETGELKSAQVLK